MASSVRQQMIANAGYSQPSQTTQQQTTNRQLPSDFSKSPNGAPMGTGINTALYRQLVAKGVDKTTAYNHVVYGTPLETTSNASNSAVGLFVPYKDNSVNTPSYKNTVSNSTPAVDSKYGVFQKNYDSLSPEDKAAVDYAMGNSYLGNNVNLGQPLVDSITEFQNQQLEPKYQSDLNYDQQSLANSVDAIKNSYNANLSDLKAQEALDNRQRSLDDAKSGMFSSTARNLRLNSFTNNYNNKYNQLYNTTANNLRSKSLDYANKYGSDNTPEINIDSITRTPEEYNTGNVSQAYNYSIKPFGIQNNALINRKNQAKLLAKDVIGKLTQNKNY